MKKVVKKLLAVGMSIVTILSVTACNESKGSGTGGSNGTTQTEQPVGTVTPSKTLWDMELDTLHEVNVTEGTKDFIVNGETDYKIVLPEELPNKRTGFAAEELKYFLDLATGSDMEIITDEGLTHTSTSKYLSVGETKLAKDAGISVDKEKLTRSGLRIVSKDESVFLLGGGDYGTLYAVYEFLTHEIGYEAYSQTEIHYEESSTIKLHEYDVTDVPDFEINLLTHGWMWNDETICERMRFKREDDVWMGPNNIKWHNTFAYLPPEQYKAEHDKWYAQNANQLCFTTRGDKTEFEKFFAEFMKNFIAVVEAHPTIDNITITQQDSGGWCQCSACKAEKNKYGGSDAAVIVKFCNKVSVALEEYFEEKGIDRKVNICFFAYQKTQTAPVKKDANGNYVPYYNDVICRDNVYCFYAPIYADFVRSLTSSTNTDVAETMKMWASIAPHTYLWIYATRFYDFLTPYNAIDSMQETYIFAKSCGVSYMYDQTEFNNAQSTDWKTLRAYLQTKMAWNVKSSQEELVAEFMEHYYKDAGEAMAKAFGAYSTWWEYLKARGSIPNGSYHSTKIWDNANWPKGFVDTMLGYFEEAYEAIEYLKMTDVELYDELYRRISLESLVYRYLNITKYASYYTSDEIYQMKLSFRDDARNTGISYWTESKPMNDLFTEWGV